MEGESEAAYYALEMQVFDMLHARHAPILLEGAGERFEEAGTLFGLTEFGAHIFVGKIRLNQLTDLSFHFHSNSCPHGGIPKHRGSFGQVSLSVLRVLHHAVVSCPYAEGGRLGGW